MQALVKGVMDTQPVRLSSSGRLLRAAFRNAGWSPGPRNRGVHGPGAARCGGPPTPSPSANSSGRTAQGPNGPEAHLRS